MSAAWTYRKWSRDRARRGGPIRGQGGLGWTGVSHDDFGDGNWDWKSFRGGNWVIKREVACFDLRLGRKDIGTKISGKELNKMGEMAAHESIVSGESTPTETRDKTFFNPTKLPWVCYEITENSKWKY